LFTSISSLSFRRIDPSRLPRDHFSFFAHYLRSKDIRKTDGDPPNWIVRAFKLTAITE
jgi:hypothetical protein